MDIPALMNEAWRKAEEASRQGHTRKAYLLTLVGNILEGVLSSETPDRVVKSAVDNADDIYGGRS